MQIAMIGYAFMGRAHSNAWRQAGRFFELPAEPEMAVVCGRSETAVADAARKLGWREHATDWREVVAREDVDLVDVCTPGDSHEEITIAALEAGKHVLCEKPLANDVAGATRMRDAAVASGRAHMVCHNYRRAPAVALAKQWIDEGRIGEIRHWRGTYLQDWIVDPDFPRVWRLEKSKAGSGALGDIASHSIDLARHLVGEIAEVSGLLETFVRERPLEDGDGRGAVDVDDAALALLRFENGAVGSVEATRMAPGRKNHNRFEINGSEGSLAFDLERMNELELYLRADEASGTAGFRTVLATEAAHPYVAAWWPPGHVLGYEHTFVHTVHDLLRAIDAEEPPSPGFEDGLRNQRVLEAVERSHDSRAWEAV